MQNIPEKSSSGARLDRRSSHVITVAHLFAYMHGQSIMDSMFGKDSDIFSSRNEITASKEFKEYFDSGKLAIVPDMSDSWNCGVDQLAHRL